MSSRTPPPPSPAATSDVELISSDLLQVATLLADRDVYGLVWLDAALVACRSYGRLVDFVVLNHPISESVLPLIGLEDDILATADRGAPALSVPSVSIVTASGATPRINLTVLCLDQQAPAFVLLVTRAVSRSDSELELTRQTRGRRMAESELVAKSRELARANRDLEDFASIVSHDLAAPMRAMRYLTDDIERQISDPAAGDPHPTLQRMRALSLRLTTMMTGLLEFSSIGRKRDAIETVDTAALIETVVRAIPRPPGISITIAGHWPTLRTLAAPLDLALRNLIDNAVKHHDRPDGTVSVRAGETADGLEITVADDGPGIADEHRDAVFLPFRTISPQRSQNGSGLGLALVKRHVEQLGGRLQVATNTEAGRGCIFTLCWPKTFTD